MSLRRFIIIVCLLYPALINASGFGIVMGTAPSKYNCESITGQTGLFTCNAPKPHSAFETYAVRASESHGICWVKGIGKTISDNGYGTSTKTKLTELQSILSKAYGEISDTNDFLMPGALWDEPKEWLMAIQQKQRSYSVSWNDLQISTKPKLKEIYLGVGSTGSSHGFIALEYYSKVYADCMSAIAESESDAL